jgi:hypothetical protein
MHSLHPAAALSRNWGRNALCVHNCTSCQHTAKRPFVWAWKSDKNTPPAISITGIDVKMMRLLRTVAVLAVLAAATEATIHMVYNLNLQTDNTIRQHVNETTPTSVDCHWTETNGTVLDDAAFTRLNATTYNGKGFCVLKLANFELNDNGRMLLLTYKNHTYAVQIFEGLDPNHYFFVVFFIILVVVMLAFVVFLGITFRSCRRRSGQIKLLLVPS